MIPRPKTDLRSVAEVIFYIAIGSLFTLAYVLVCRLAESTGGVVGH